MARLPHRARAGHLAVVYSRGTGRIRSIVIPDSDAETIAVFLGPGENLHDGYPRRTFTSVPALQECLSGDLDRHPTHDRYAIVDSRGHVVGATYADPWCGDQVAGHELVAHPRAAVGWRRAADGQLLQGEA